MGKYTNHRNRSILSGLCALYALSILACSPDMSDQPKYRPLRESDFFSDGRSARPALEGTVARGHLRVNNPFYTGRENGDLLDNVPVPLTKELLEHGRERFDIFCTPCHGYVGDGYGMVVQRGFQRPPSYHIDRLREMPDGYFFDVITHGKGAMASYASRVPTRDRWAITAYVRALQLSQGAKMDDVPPGERQRLMNTKK